MLKPKQHPGIRHNCIRLHAGPQWRGVRSGFGARHGILQRPRDLRVLSLAYKSAAGEAEGRSPQPRNLQRDYEISASQVLCQFIVNHAVPHEKAGIVIGVFDAAGKPAHRLPLAQQTPGVWHLKAWMAVPSDSRIQFQVGLAQGAHGPAVWEAGGPRTISVPPLPHSDNPSPQSLSVTCEQVEFPEEGMMGALRSAFLSMIGPSPTSSEAKVITKLSPPSSNSNSSSSNTSGATAPSPSPGPSAGSDHSSNGNGSIQIQNGSTAKGSGAVHKGAGSPGLPDRGKVTLKVVVPNHNSFGAQLVLCGGSPALGSWQPWHAVALEWCEGDSWVGSVELPLAEALAGVEAKLVAVSNWDKVKSRGKAGDKDVAWEKGNNRVIKLPMPFSPVGQYSATLAWGNTTSGGTATRAVAAGAPVSLKLQVSGVPESLVEEGPGQLMLVGGDVSVGSWALVGGLVFTAPLKQHRAPLERSPEAGSDAWSRSLASSLTHGHSSHFAGGRSHTSASSSQPWTATITVPSASIIEAKLVWVPSTPKTPSSSSTSCASSSAASKAKQPSGNGSSSITSKKEGGGSTPEGGPVWEAGVNRVISVADVRSLSQPINLTWRTPAPPTPTPSPSPSPAPASAQSNMTAFTSGSAPGKGSLNSSSTVANQGKVNNNGSSNGSSVATDIGSRSSIKAGNGAQAAQTQHSGSHSSRNGNGAGNGHKQQQQQQHQKQHQAPAPHQNSHHHKKSPSPGRKWNHHGPQPPTVPKVEIPKPILKPKNAARSPSMSDTIAALRHAARTARTAELEWIESRGSSSDSEAGPLTGRGRAYSPLTHRRSRSVGPAGDATTRVYVSGRSGLKAPGSGGRHVEGPPAAVRVYVPRYEGNPGQRLLLVGGHPSLGSWSPHCTSIVLEATGQDGAWVGTGHLPTGLPLEGKLVAVEGDLSPPPTSPSRTMSRGRSASLEAVLGNAAGNGYWSAGSSGEEEDGADLVPPAPRAKLSWEKGDNRVFQVEPGVETTLVMEWDTPSVTTAVVDAVCCELHVPSKVVPPGHVVSVVGPTPELGAWNPSHAMPLAWSYGSNWAGCAFLPRAQVYRGLELRLLVCGRPPEPGIPPPPPVWEDEHGRPRVIKLEDPSVTAVRVSLVWGSTQPAAVWTIAGSIGTTWTPPASPPPAISTPSPLGSLISDSAASSYASSDSSVVTAEGVSLDGAETVSGVGKGYRDEEQGLVERGASPALPSSTSTEGPNASTGGTSSPAPPPAASHRSPSPANNVLSSFFGLGRIFGMRGGGAGNNNSNPTPNNPDTNSASSSTSSSSGGVFNSRRQQVSTTGSKPNGRASSVFALGMGRTSSSGSAGSVAAATTAADVSSVSPVSSAKPTGALPAEPQVPQEVVQSALTNAAIAKAALAARAQRQGSSGGTGGSVGNSNGNGAAAAGALSDPVQRLLQEQKKMQALMRARKAGAAGGAVPSVNTLHSAGGDGGGGASITGSGSAASSISTHPPAASSAHDIVNTGVAAVVDGSEQSVVGPPSFTPAASPAPVELSKPKSAAAAANAPVEVSPQALQVSHSATQAYPAGTDVNEDIPAGNQLGEGLAVLDAGTALPAGITSTTDNITSSAAEQAAALPEVQAGTPPLPPSPEPPATPATRRRTPRSTTGLNGGSSSRASKASRNSSSTSTSSSGTSGGTSGGGSSTPAVRGRPPKRLSSPSTGTGSTDVGFTVTTVDSPQDNPALTVLRAAASADAVQVLPVLQVPHMGLPPGPAPPGGDGSEVSHEGLEKGKEGKLASGMKHVLVGSAATSSSSSSSAAVNGATGAGSVAPTPTTSAADHSDGNGSPSPVFPSAQARAAFITGITATASIAIPGQKPAAASASKGKGTRSARSTAGGRSRVAADAAGKSGANSSGNASGDNTKTPASPAANSNSDLASNLDAVSPCIRANPGSAAAGPATTPAVAPAAAADGAHGTLGAPTNTTSPGKVAKVAPSTNMTGTGASSPSPSPSPAPAAAPSPPAWALSAFDEEAAVTPGPSTGGAAQSAGGPGNQGISDDARGAGGGDSQLRGMARLSPGGAILRTASTGAEPDDFSLLSWDLMIDIEEEQQQ